MLIAAALVATPLAATGIEGFKHSSWTPEQGAPSNVVGIAQTPDGYLWIASAEGVFRFDGLSFESIPAPREARFANAIPTSVFADRDGRLWVGFNQNAGAAVYRAGRLHALSMPSPPPSILKFTQTADGALWASWGGQGDRLFRYRNDNWQVMDRRLNLPPGEIAAMASTADGSLWVTLGNSRADGTLARLLPGAARFQTEADRIGFTMLARAPDGALWISDRNATRMIRDAKGAPPVRPRLFPPVGGAAVPTLAFDRRGGIWGTTRGVGLFRLDPTTGTGVERLEVGRMLSSDATIDAFTDREGSIWVATDVGLDRYRPAAIARLSAIPADVQDGLKLARANDGTVFVAGSQALYALAPGGPARRIADGLGRVATLCPASDGGIWIAHGGSMTRYDATGSLTTSFALPPDPVAPTSCAQDRGGRLWIDGAGTIWVGTKARWQRAAADLQGGGALDIVADPDGSGVLVNTGHADLLKLDAVTSRGVPGPPLAIGALAALWTSRDGVYASGAKGIARIAGGRVQRIEATNNPWLVGVRGMALGKDGAAWFLVRLGIVRVAVRDLARGFAAPTTALPHRLFDSHDGYATRGQAISFRTPQVAATGDGRLIFATRAGPLLVDPADAVRSPLSPPVSIRSISVGSLVRRDPPASLTLPAGTHTVRIGFAVNSLAVPSRNRAFYRLEGQSGGWTAAGGRREATYTNLGPGRYRFQVIGVSADGVWNRRGQTQAIEIPPTFLQSWTFKLLCMALGLALLWVAYRIRLRFLAREIRSRLLDRLRERERVARDIHDTLLQSIQALMLRFQLAADGLPAGHPARGQLEEAMDRADDVIAEGRDRLSDLRRTEGLEDPEAALREIAGHQLAGTAIAITIRSSGTVRPIDAVAWDELASIAAEVLFNAARHAHASAMVAEIQYRSTGLTLRITDDGIGIPPHMAKEGRQGHFGIAGMRERAARIGGHFRIERRREGGTEVTVTVPAAMVYGSSRKR